MYTEAEAKEKWCCTVFVNIFHVDPSMQSTPRMCVGSLCMAWRWDEDIEAYNAKYAKAKAYEVVPEPMERKGYCGLAGRE